MKMILTLLALCAMQAVSAQQIVVDGDQCQIAVGGETRGWACPVVGDPDPDPGPVQCVDGIDNDGDGLIDRNDPGCSSPQDDDESDGGDPPPPPVPECNDGIDNDSDGLVDLNDPGCDSADDDSEADTPPPPPPGEAGVYPGVPAYPYREALPSVAEAADFTSCSASNGSPTDVSGTADDWAVVTLNPSQKCFITGSYFVVQNSNIVDRLGVTGGPYVVRNNIITADSRNALIPSGVGVLIEDNVIEGAGTIPSEQDNHGINVGRDTDGMWILDNQINENSGDAVQFCHSCVDKDGVPEGPAHVYIAGNTMKDNEENAIDLKEFAGPVVVVCNRMEGYERGTFSGNGEAFRINDEGNQGELWSSKNTYRDNLTDIAPYSSEAEGYYLDEDTSSARDFIDDERSNTQAYVSGAAAQQYYDLYESRYGLDLSAGCPE